MVPPNRTDNGVEGAMSETDFDVSIDDIEVARGNIAGRVRSTPLYASAALGELVGCTVSAKQESLQLGGSFKIRGVLNRLLGMSTAERKRGVVTVSGGNHAIAVALVAHMLDIPVKVMMARWRVSPTPKWLTPLAGASCGHVAGFRFAILSSVRQGRHAVRKTAENASAFRSPELVGICRFNFFGMMEADEDNRVHCFAVVVKLGHKRIQGCHFGRRTVDA